VIWALSQQVLELVRCSLTDDDLPVLCKGFADARCRVRVLLLSGNIDLGDRGAAGEQSINTSSASFVGVDHFGTAVLMTTATNLGSLGRWRVDKTKLIRKK